MEIFDEDIKLFTQEIPWVKNGLDFYVDFCVPMIPLISISK